MPAFGSGNGKRESEAEEWRAAERTSSQPGTGVDVPAEETGGGWRRRSQSGGVETQGRKRLKNQGAEEQGTLTEERASASELSCRGGGTGGLGTAGSKLLDKGNGE